MLPVRPPEMTINFPGMWYPSCMEDIQNQSLKIYNTTIMHHDSQCGGILLGQITTRDFKSATMRITARIQKNSFWMGVKFFFQLDRWCRPVTISPYPFDERLKPNAVSPSISTGAQASLPENDHCRANKQTYPSRVLYTLFQKIWDIVSDVDEQDAMDVSKQAWVVGVWKRLTRALFGWDKQRSRLVTVLTVSRDGPCIKH